MFVRTRGVGPDEQVIIVHHGAHRPVEVVRHCRASPGSPAIDDTHFPDHTAKVSGDYTVVPRPKAEAEFLAIGYGARTWLLEAAAAGTATLAMIAGAAEVDQASGTAAIHGRFGTGDLHSILDSATMTATTHAAGESRSLTQSTAGWAAIGSSPLVAPTVAGKSGESE